MSIRIFAAIALCVAAICLAGCQSGPSSLSPSTSAYFPATTTTPARARAGDASVPTIAVDQPLVIAAPTPLVVPPSETVPAVSTPMPELRPAWPSNWVNAWIALESWCQFNGLSKPQQMSSGLEATYQLQTTNGPMTVRMGSHAAHYSGAEFWFGFAPKLIRGLPYVHALDARKTLQPLLGQPFQIPSPHRTIVIDPGHGGKDVGARNCVNGEYEKYYALDWARRLQRLLLADGWNVILTRSNDTYVPLGDRVAAAEQAKADLFLSLHFNIGTGNGVQSGVETYCLTPSGMPSNLLRDERDDPRQRHPNNAFDDQNFQLASRVHRSVLAATGANDRGVRRARFMSVLRGQSRPAVLIEAGYLTNPSEARKIGTSAYRQALAEGVAKALE